MEKILCTLILNIQSYNDIITNSSSEVVVHYNKDGVTTLKAMVNLLIDPFTSLTFNDLFDLYYVHYDSSTDKIEELPEDYPELDKVIEESRDVVYDGGFPTITGIKIVSKEGKNLELAAQLLENIATTFNTDIVYG